MFFLFYTFASIVTVLPRRYFCLFYFLNISAVAGVVGELRVGAAVGGRVPYVQVHVRAEGVEARVLDGGAVALGLPGEGGVRRGDRGHRGRPLGVEVALVGLALRRPDGPEQAGHGGEAAGTREVWLEGERERGEREREIQC